MFTKTTIFTIFAILFIWTCTETVQPELHPKQWMDPESYDFHGNQIALKGLDALETCKTCHGENYTGGTSTISCSDCHEGGYSGHPNIISHLTPDSTEFHGNIVSESGLEGANEECGSCHGTMLDGGKVDVSCYLCHAGGPSGHPEIWSHIDPNSDDFHALGFTQNTFDEDVSHCLECHTIYQEDNSEITSCYECHQNYPFFE
ncbi:MAG: hypothetical protein ISR90_05280 [Candidatus Marinimicrobia bacterium]|nr:hypothetical protein [Candidatus Neomarinimicrobiota bacterium]MBL7023448.1 hypothetical protein [Candidatus Neomarinimicrobiota bacterium]MBL7108803.1 hypothetical protein [Candidatus Neomarinimicrobiota bacterium]